MVVPDLILETTKTIKIIKKTTSPTYSTTIRILKIKEEICCVIEASKRIPKAELPAEGNLRNTRILGV